MPRYLFVPQGCYVEISHLTDKQCVGLITHGMTRCYPVAVVVKGHIFLCHADYSTDISDENHGVPAWVSLAAARSKDVVKIYLGSMYSDAENDYKDAIIASLECRGLQGRYKIISLGIWEQIIINRDTGKKSDEISDDQSNCRRNIKLESFVNCLIGKDDSDKVRSPIQIFSAHESKYYSAQYIIEQNTARFAEILRKCRKSDARIIDMENKFFIDASAYIEKKFRCDCCLMLSPITLEEFRKTYPEQYRQTYIFSEEGTFYFIDGSIQKISNKKLSELKENPHLREILTGGYGTKKELADEDLQNITSTIGHNLSEVGLVGQKPPKFRQSFNCCNKLIISTK